MEIIDAIFKRVSIREYKDDLVDKEVLEKLIDIGRRAPTARKVEPLEFIIVQDKSVLAKLSVLAPNGKFVKDAAACIVVFSSDTPYYLEDGCAATENILLAVADFGLGACWIAGDKKPYAGEVTSLLGAPKDLKLISMISIGWPKVDIQQTRSRELSDIIHWDKF